MKSQIQNSVKNNFKTMFKKVIVIVLIAFSPSILQAQDSIFDKYDGLDNVKSIIVNKKMFEMMSKVKMDGKDKEAQQYVNLIRKLDNLKVFTTSSNRTANDMKITVDKYLKSSNLDELMRISDGGKNVKIFIKSGKTDSQVKELLMFIQGADIKGDDTVLMSLTGDFDLNEISTLTNKMNIPGGDVLKKASKSSK